MNATSLAGSRSLLGRAGLFLPTATLSGWLACGSGIVMNESVVRSERLALGEGLVLSETGQPNPSTPNDAGLLGEP